MSYEADVSVKASGKEGRKEGRKGRERKVGGKKK